MDARKRRQRRHRIHLRTRRRAARRRPAERMRFGRLLRCLAVSVVPALVVARYVIPRLPR